MGQPFDWMESPAPAARGTDDKRERVLRRELEERAGLLYRLGHGAAAIKARLRGQLEWEYERNTPVPLLGEVDALVDGVLARRGATRHGEPPLD